MVQHMVEIHLACKVAMAALEVVRDEDLCENSQTLGQKFRDELSEFSNLFN